MWLSVYLLVYTALIWTESWGLVVFQHCPAGEVLLTLPEGSNDAYCDVDIESVDADGNIIPHEVLGNINIPGNVEFNEQTRAGIHIIAHAALGRYDAWCQFQLKVVDPYPPNITFCPPDQWQNTSKDAVEIHWSPPVATDNIDLYSVSTNRPSGSEFTVKGSPHTVTVAAIDSSGNVATCSFEITIIHNTLAAECQDLQVPINGALSCGNIPGGFQCNVHCEERYKPYKNIYVYTCNDRNWNPLEKPRCIKEMVSFRRCPLATKILSVGEYNDTAYLDVDIEAIDANGNVVPHEVLGDIQIPGIIEFNNLTMYGLNVSARAYVGQYMAICQFQIKVVDPYPPKITLCPRDQVQNTSKDAVLIEWSPPSVTDNTELEDVTTIPTSGSIFSLFGSPHLVNVTATDTSGNVATCSFVVTIIHIQVRCQDLQSPVHGALSCGNIQSVFRCVVHCEEGYEPYRDRGVYICTEGIWSPSNTPRCVLVLIPGPV